MPYWQLPPFVFWPNRPRTPQSHKSHQRTPHKFQTLKHSTTPDWQNLKHPQASSLKDFQALLLQEFNHDSQDSQQILPQKLSRKARTQKLSQKLKKVKQKHKPSSNRQELKAQKTLRS